ncbi:mitogen-activated protein kinase kinase kinase 1-like isoform X2 [Syzygium oleosum]|uniref:mitogen-activated protein kinase kinase kinase 1-like isoform X2 n=1 Tax=Syzygium oleosum TaxID=219896 RepID=UPI0024BB808B|nr:mitogen-activated protein kinase kinase kinase 1-like isoform X2 [Syzygium oleosum]
MEGEGSESMAAPPPPPPKIFHSGISHEVDGSSGVDSGCLWSTAAGDEKEPRDGDGVRNTPSAPPRWHTVSPQGSLNPKFTSWRKIRKLGRGSFADVYKVITDDGFFFAVKEVPLWDQGHQGKLTLLQLAKEINLYRRFEHENIVRYIGTDKDDKKLYIFLELMTKGSLATLYHKYNLTDSQVSAFTRQILNGLKYLHDQNVVHRDIKCANILVDAGGSVKLADFGLAKATEMRAAKSFLGTTQWIAPEVVKSLKNGSYELAADIWSLGCTVLEMLTREPPYSHLGPMEALEEIRAGVLPEVPESLSTDAQDFIRKCLCVDPKDRPSAAKLLGHPFVRKPPTSSGFFAPPR